MRTAVAGREETIKWGRSVMGCDGCGNAQALAGYEVKVDGAIAARLCHTCAHNWRPGKYAAPARKPRARAPRRLHTA